MLGRHSQRPRRFFAHFHLASLCLNGIAHTFPSPLEKGISAAKLGINTGKRLVWVEFCKPTDCANDDGWRNKAATKRVHWSEVLKLYGFLLSFNDLCGYSTGFTKLHLFLGNTIFVCIAIKESFQKAEMSPLDFRSHALALAVPSLLDTPIRHVCSHHVTPH